MCTINEGGSGRIFRIKELDKAFAFRFMSVGKKVQEETRTTGPGQEFSLYVKQSFVVSVNDDRKMSLSQKVSPLNKCQFVY